MYHVNLSSFPVWPLKKTKATKYYEVGSVYSKQEQQKSFSYKYLCFSSHSEETENLIQKVGKLESKLEEERRQMAEDTMEKLSKTSPVCLVKGKEDHREEQAAKIIQKQWKMFRKKKEEIALDEAVVMLQAAFKGHLARQKLLLNTRMHDAKSHQKNCCASSMSNSLSLSADCKKEDEIVTFIQSIFRAHLARTVLLEESPSVSSEKPDSAAYSTEKKPVPAALQRPPPISMSSVPARSSEERWQPTPSLPGDEAHSDDSDDVVIVPSLLQMKKNYTHF